MRDPAPGYFDASIGSFRKFVKQVHIVSKDGQIEHVTPSNAARFASVFEYDSSDIITGAIFRTLPAAQSDRVWLARMYVPYSEHVYTAITKKIFTGLDALPKHVDVTVQTGVVRKNLNTINVTLAGQAPTSLARASVRTAAAALFPPGVAEMAEDHFSIHSGADAVKATVEANEMATQTLGRMTKYHFVEVAGDAVPKFVPTFLNVVDGFLGKTDREVSKHAKLTAALRLKRVGTFKTAVAAHVIAPRVPSVEDSQLCKEMDAIVPALLAKPSTCGNKAVDVKKEFTTPTGGVVIDDFEGVVYDESDGDAYKEAIYQYASTSYPEEDMTPYAIAFPESFEDVQRAVAFAKSTGLALVPRSGGHQYSGLSSGGKDTLVLAMDFFSEIDPSTIDGKPHMTIGVGTVLDHISTALADAHVFCPHGQCPTVAMGGHAQSGGYGLIIRGFGLLQDYIHSFRIVLADGTYPTIVRPNSGPDVQPVHPDNDDIFFAVLGGGPGSWGVLTHVTTEVITDAERPGSGGVQGFMSCNKRRLRAAMNLLKRYTEGAADGSLPDDFDISLSVLSIDYVNNLLAIANDKFGEEGSNAWTIMRSTPELLRRVWPGMILLELCYSNKDGVVHDDSDPSSPINRLKAEYDVIDKLGGPISFSIKEYEGVVPMSEICDNYVQRLGTMGDGREFVYPYKKRLNGTVKPITADFVDEFCALLDDIMDEKDVYVILLAIVGGGQFKNHPKRADTAGQKRDSNMMLCCDVFYTKDHEALAEEYQERIRRILVQTTEAEDSVRFAWGTFGETDINKVWGNYYDDETVYSRLKAIKAKVDPSNLFRTRFTVPPAEK